MDMSLLQTKMKPATPLPELQTVEDIYRWIDENIAYGWQDKDLSLIHISEPTRRS